MKKRYRSLLIIFAGTMLLGLGADQCLSADTEATTPAIQKRVTPAERQAAANRAKAQGFVAPKVFPTTTSTAPQVDTSTTPDATPEAKGGQ